MAPSTAATGPWKGIPACAYSRDKGHTWSTPEYKRYLDGRLMKHPRAANFVWRLASGRYLYWFHNHGGHFLREGLAANSHYSFENRNPVWLSAGTEIDGPDGKVLLWSQPEIAIYADDSMFRISYPHLFEDGGKVFVAETNKSVARMHELDPVLLQGMFDQENLDTVAVDGMVLKMSDSVGLRGEVAMPRLPDLSCFDHRRPDYRGLNLRRGLSIDLWIEFGELAAGQVILDNRRELGEGFAIRIAEGGAVEIALRDIQTECRWGCEHGLIKAGARHHVAIIVDGGPRIVSFVIDGRFCDGGDQRQFGWGHFSADLRTVNGAPELKIAPRFAGRILSLRIYDRYLRTSEAIGNWRAGI